MAGALLFFLTLLSSILSVSAALNPCVVNGHNYNVDEVIARDISIIGGGSAGTYSAIRLRDLGKSVAVVERTGRLGGNTETYTDPNTGATIDIGVMIFHNFPVVTNYFARLGVASTTVFPAAPNPNLVSEYADFQTGKLDLSFSRGNVPAALITYGKQIAQYPYLDFGWDLPDPIPADLLLSFGQFVKKYSLDAIIQITWLFTQGIGDLLSRPTVYVLKYFGLSTLESLENGFLTTALHDNSLLYLSAQDILGSDVLYNSTILDVQRDNGVQVVIKQDSKLTLLKSDQIVIAIPPKLDNLNGFDITQQEARLFGQFTSTEYFTGLLRNTGIPSNISLTNVAPGAPYSLPSPPFIYTIDQTGIPDLIHVYYLSTTPTTDDEIPNAIIDQVKKLNIPGKGPSDPVVAVSSNHCPYELSVDANAVNNGFYRDLNSVQGVKNTWWTGAAWHAHDSSLIWRFTEGLLGNITSA